MDWWIDSEVNGAQQRDPPDNLTHVGQFYTLPHEMSSMRVGRYGFVRMGVMWHHGEWWTRETVRHGGCSETLGKPVWMIWDGGHENL